jgi:hypothetical protein
MLALCPFVTGMMYTDQCGARTAPHTTYTREVACWAAAQHHQVSDFPFFFFPFSVLFFVECEYILLKNKKFQYLNIFNFEQFLKWNVL